MSYNHKNINALKAMCQEMLSEHQMRIVQSLIEEYEKTIRSVLRKRNEQGRFSK